MKASISLSRLASLLLLDVAVGLGKLRAQFALHLLKVDALEHFANCFSTDGGGEAVCAEFLLCLEVFILGQELTILERRETRLKHDVVFEVQDALEVLERHVEQQANAARQRLQEPDVRDRRSQLNVAHALAPHA